MDKEQIAELFARETGFHIDFISFDIGGFVRAIRNDALEEVAQRFDMTGRDLAAADVRALKTKEGE